MLKKLLFAVLSLCAFSFLNAQSDMILPRGFAPGEAEKMPTYIQDRLAKDACAIATPPEVPIRSIAEWEELQAIVVAWDSADYGLLADIIRHARLECEVVVIARNVSTAQTQLLNTYGFDNLDNIRFVQENFNSIWIRDYGGNACYMDDVDSLVWVDWIYNRPRYLDDEVFCTLSEELGIPMYQTVSVPNDLVHTGGNYMTDGLGMAFSSKLVLEENDETNPFGISNHSEEDIDEIMRTFMGIYEYPKMETLPYDGIHHIDMHMKLLDEETLLVGAYPDGISDGPQIEANLEYIQQNYKTSFGTDFKIVRIDMPPDASGNYPGWAYGNSDYLTYANALVVNKTILVPIYQSPYDEAALAVWREAKPGYQVVGLDCRDIIRYSGAIHCITKEVGVANPLWITHQQLRDTIIPQDIAEHFPVTAQIKHRSGIASANLYYRGVPEVEYTAVPMQQLDDTDTWTATIPNITPNNAIQYYIEATAHSGKTQVRPLPAPEAYFEFFVDAIVSTDSPDTYFEVGEVFPNPAQALTYVPVTTQEAHPARITIVDIHGRTLTTVYDGKLETGAYSYFFDASKLTPGIYFVQIHTPQGVLTRKFLRV